jgi:hypothetical protein
MESLNTTKQTSTSSTFFKEESNAFKSEDFGSVDVE